MSQKFAPCLSLKEEPKLAGRPAARLQQRATSKLVEKVLWTPICVSLLDCNSVGTEVPEGPQWSSSKPKKRTDRGVATTAMATQH